MAIFRTSVLVGVLILVGIVCLLTGMPWFWLLLAITGVWILVPAALCRYSMKLFNDGQQAMLDLHYSKATTCYRRARMVLKWALSGPPNVELGFVNALAESRLLEGDLEEAGKLAHQVLGVVEQRPIGNAKLGRDSAEGPLMHAELQAVSTLASIAVRNKRFSEAENFLERGHKITVSEACRDGLVGMTLQFNVDVLRIENAMEFGNLCVATRQLDRAEQKYLDAIELTASARARWSKSTESQRCCQALALGSLAPLKLMTLYLALGKAQKVVPLCEAVLHRNREFYTVLPNVEADDLMLAGNACIMTGDYECGREKFLKASDLWSQALGPLDWRVGNALIGVANVEFRLGNYSEAERYCLRSVAILETATKCHHLIFLAISLASLGVVESKTGKPATG